MFRYAVPLLCATMLSACVPGAPPQPDARTGSSLPPRFPSSLPPPSALAEPVDTTLTATRGGAVATLNDLTLYYEGTISDGRPRFYEVVPSTGTGKDVVFDRRRSNAYPFGRYDVVILRSDPERLVYRIEPAD